MFSKPTKVAAAPVVAKGKATHPVTMIPGWEEVAALDICHKAIEGELKTRKAALSAVLSERMIASGAIRKSKPDTMHPLEGHATGSAFLTRRDARSPLSEDETTLIASLVPGGAEVDADGNETVPGFTEIAQKTPDYLGVHPDYLPGGALYDAAIFRRIDKALKPLVESGQIPDNLIVQVEGERKTVIAETALDRVFALDPKVIETLLPILGGVRMRPAYQSLAAAWAFVKPILEGCDRKRAA